MSESQTARSLRVNDVTGFADMSWKAIRVAGDDAVEGELGLDAGSMTFQPGTGFRSAAPEWTFTCELTELDEVRATEPTLRHWPHSLDRGIRVRSADGSQATFYLGGRRASNRVDTIVAGIKELALHAASPSEARTVVYVDRAEGAQVGESASIQRGLQRYSWLAGLLCIAVFGPELVSDFNTGRSAAERAWVLVYPGNFVAIGIWQAAGVFVKGRNHPLLATLPVCLYLVGSALLALTIYAFYEISTAAALVPLLFGVPAALVAVVTLLPRRLRAWREARDNDRAATRDS